jgi:predicted RNA-binding protein with PIN domain
VHWLIDVMNVIGSRPDRWWNNPDRAMREMAQSLDEFAKLTGDAVTAVLDSDPGDLPEVAQADVVIASRRGRNAADLEILRILSTLDTVESVVVVTSDKRLKEKVAAAGARVTPSGSFRGRLDEALRSTR